MTDCALTTNSSNTTTCFIPIHVDTITNFTKGNTLEEVKKETNCEGDNADQCILEKASLPAEVKQKIEREAFKAPVDSFDHNYWLNNTQIDTVMSQLRLQNVGFTHSFIHMIDLKGFNPTNYKSFDYPVHELKKINFAAEFAKALSERGIIKEKVNIAEPQLIAYDNSPLHSFGVVCNTDSSNGSGQHWFAIFISTDQKDPDDTSKPWIRIEIFNSAGGGSVDEDFNTFWEKQASAISQATGLKCTFDTITQFAHQRSDTGNCGSYSLFYIYSRLNGILPHEFDNPNKPIKDYAMQKFRKVCFRIDKDNNLF